MGQYVIRPEPDKDFYILWNSFWDAPRAWGPRNELRLHDDVTIEMIERAVEGDADSGEVFRYPMKESPNGFLYCSRMRAVCDILADDQKGKRKRVRALLTETWGDDGD